MSRVQNYSFSGYPSSYDTSLSSTSGTRTPEDGCKATTGSTSKYARFTGSGTESRIWYYKFDTSEISQFANITSVSWKAKVTVANKNTWTLSLANLTTSVGDAQTPTKVTLYTTPETNGGNWSVGDLNNLRFKINPTSGTATNYFYGADLYINYSITWYSISAASSVAGVSITSSAAEVESGNSVTLTTNASSLTGITIKDNGVDATSNFTGTSGNYRYTLTNVNADHSFTVTEKSSQGSGVFTKEGGVWNEAPAVYKMINSAWVKQTDAQNIFTDSVYLKTDGTLFIRKNL
jgi:hypothetical protein